MSVFYSAEFAIGRSWRRPSASRISPAKLQSFRSGYRSSLLKRQGQFVVLLLSNRKQTHPVLRHRSKDVTPWPAETPLQPTALEVLIKETDDPEFERLKAATARHLALLPAHEAAVAPVLEGLSRLKEQLVQLLDPEL